MVRRVFMVTAIAASAAIACGLVIARHVSVETPIAMRVAQSSCPDQCRASYGQCMKSSANRPACQGQLDACMKSCVATKTR